MAPFGSPRPIKVPRMPRLMPHGMIYTIVNRTPIIQLKLWPGSRNKTDRIFSLNLQLVLSEFPKKISTGSMDHLSRLSSRRMLVVAT